MDTLPEYDVGRTLGVGATGRVRLGQHKQSGHLVALKMVPRNFILTPGQVSQAVRREIAVLHLIASGNSAVEGVLTLHDVVDTDEHTVLALEYCTGGDLFELLLNEGRLPLALVRQYFHQLAKALYFCHKRGICHRDLKPENILISADGNLKIADFGMSGLLKPSGLLETSCGSPHYCAPEVLSGERYNGSEADVWSLGVILFAMITGGLPFDDDNLHRLTRKVCSGRFYMPPEVPEEVANLIRNMLTVAPGHRISLEAVLRSEWLSDYAFPDVEEEFLLEKDLPPVIAPDERIITFLGDLGLGSDYMLRRRLGGKRNCLERRMYYRFLAVMNNEPVAPAKVPSEALTPTTITASVFYEKEESCEQVTLEEALGEMKLSEPFKEIPKDITDEVSRTSCAAAVINSRSLDVLVVPSTLCVQFGRSMSSKSAEPLRSPTDISHNAPLQRFNSDTGKDYISAAREFFDTGMGLGVQDTLVSPLSSRRPSWLNIFQVPGTLSTGT